MPRQVKAPPTIITTWTHQKVAMQFPTTPATKLVQDHSIVTPRYNHTRQVDISKSGWLIEGQDCESPLKGGSICGRFIKGMAFWATAHMLLSRFERTLHFPNHSMSAPSRLRYFR